MSRKGKKPNFGVVISHQNSLNKKMGYGLLGILVPIFFWLITLIVQNEEGIFNAENNVNIFFEILILTLFFSIFIWLAYSTITLKKKLTIKNDILIIESNKEQRNLRADLNNMIYWQKVLYPETGISIKMQNFKFFIHSLEMDNLYGIERYLRGRFPQKEKKRKSIF